MNQESYNKKLKNTANKLRELADQAERGEAVNVLIMASAASDEGVISRYFYSGPTSGLFAHVLALPRHVSPDERMALAALFATLLVKMSEEEDRLLSAIADVHPELLAFGKMLVENWKADGELKSHLEFNHAIAAAKAFKDGIEEAEQS